MKIKKLKVKNAIDLFYAVKRCKNLQDFKGDVLLCLIDNIKCGYKIKQCKIAEKLNNNQSYVSKSIKKLVDMGLLTKSQERRNRTAEYTLNIEKINKILGGRYLEAVNGNSQSDSTISTDVEDIKLIFDKKALALIDDHVRYWIDLQAQRGNEYVENIKNEMVCSIEYQERKNVAYEDMKCLYFNETIPSECLRWAFEKVLKHYIEAKGQTNPEN